MASVQKVALKAFCQRNPTAALSSVLCARYVIIVVSWYSSESEIEKKGQREKIMSPIFKSLGIKVKIILAQRKVNENVLHLIEVPVGGTEGCAA